MSNQRFRQVAEGIIEKALKGTGRQSHPFIPSSSTPFYWEFVMGGHRKFEQQQKPFVANPRAEALIEALGADVRDSANASAEFGEPIPDLPCCAPDEDFILMPKPNRFRSSDEYYGILFHELGHWTAYRVGRYETQMRDRYGVSMEELVAEFTSAFVCDEFGIDRTDENASYVTMYANAARLDREDIDVAIARAEKAANFILSHAEALKLAA